jgi:cell division septum initiation protein DivIVA
MDQMLGFAHSTRDRLDELTRRVRGIEGLEKRVARLEKRVDEATGTKSRSARARSTSAKKTATRKTTSARKDSTAKTGGKSPG